MSIIFELNLLLLWKLLSIFYHFFYKLNNIYLKNDKLNVELLGRGFAWLDTGTHRSLLQASQYVQTIEENQGIKIACLEEIAINQGFITKQEVIKGITDQHKSSYYQYIKNNFGE